MTDLNSYKWASKTGRPIKPDRVPETIANYLQAYIIASAYQNQQQQQQQMQMDQGFQGRGGGGRGGGGSGQKNNSGNCGQHSLWWWGSLILDTGTPPGGSAPTAPAKLINMNQIYNSNNLIFEKGYLYSVPAKNGIAQGTRKPVPCTTFNHGMGFGYGYAIGTPNPYSQMSEEAINEKLALRMLWHTGIWAIDNIDKQPWTGFQRGGGGGGDGGQRMINCTVAGQQKRVAIDTGTDAILGAGNGNKQCVFPPSTQAISVPSTSHSQAPYYFMPAWNVSQAIRVCLTARHTVCQAYTGFGSDSGFAPATISYPVGGGGQQQGDPYNGQEWGSGGGQSQGQGQQPMQVAPQQQQRRSNVGYGYGYDYGGRYGFGLGFL